MKFSKEDLVRLSDLVQPLDREVMRAEYRSFRVARADQVLDMDKRYRWDLFWSATKFDQRELIFDKYTTEHVDTALRAIVPPLNQGS